MTAEAHSYERLKTTLPRDSAIPERSTSEPPARRGDGAYESPHCEVWFRRSEGDHAQKRATKPPKAWRIGMVRPPMRDEELPRRPSLWQLEPCDASCESAQGQRPPTPAACLAARTQHSGRIRCNAGVRVLRWDRHRTQHKHAWRSRNATYGREAVWGLRDRERAAQQLS